MLHWSVSILALVGMNEINEMNEIKLFMLHLEELAAAIWAACEPGFYIKFLI